MRILLVEPDRLTRVAIEQSLAAQNMNVEIATDPEEALAFARVYLFDLIITELLFDNVTGLDLIRTLRLENIPTPLLVLSVVHGVADKVRAFGFGADEYMAKPFHPDELIARIFAVVRRDRGHADLRIDIGNLVVTIGLEATVDGRRVDLSGKEMALLEVLALRKERACGREELIAHLYGTADPPELKVLDVFVCRLRRKLKQGGWVGGKIGTVWGRGWQLEELQVEHELAEARA